MNRYSKFDKQIDEIISKMTLREKIGQLNQVMVPKTKEEIEAAKEMVRRGEVGTFILADGWHAGNDPQSKVMIDILNELQASISSESTAVIWGTSVFYLIIFYRHSLLMSSNVLNIYSSHKVDRMQQPILSRMC